MEFKTRVIRLHDRFVQHTGFGSYTGCQSEALSIVRRIRRYGEEFENIAPGVWQSERVRVEVVEHRGDKIPEISFDVREFYRARLQPAPSSNYQENTWHTRDK